MNMNANEVTMQTEGMGVVYAQVRESCRCDGGGKVTLEVMC